MAFILMGKVCPVASRTRATCIDMSTKAHFLQRIEQYRHLFLRANSPTLQSHVLGKLLVFLVFVVYLSEPGEDVDVPARAAPIHHLG